MAGYTRQSTAQIFNGADITAPPLNAEFNKLEDAFDGVSGHSHNGTVGQGPKINLSTSLSGYLPPVHGGTGGKNNLAATSNPVVTNDFTQGYAVGSLWENVSTGRVFICVGNTTGSAVWRELVLVDGTAAAIIPETNNLTDLGSPSLRFQDLFLSGGISAQGNVSVGGTTALTGTLTANGAANLNGLTTAAQVDVNSGTIDGTVIGGNSPTAITGTQITANSGFVGSVTGDISGNVTSTGTSVFNNITLNGTLTSSGALNSNVIATSGASSFNDVTINGTLNMNAGTSATITNLSAPTNANDAARKVDVDNAVANLVDSAPAALDTLNELAAALGDDSDFSNTITTSIGTKLPKAGGTMTGHIILSADPTQPLHPTTKNYSDTTFLGLAGGTMTGDIALGGNKVTGLGTPSVSTDSANKAYVDNLFGSSTNAATSAAAAATSAANALVSENSAAASEAIAVSSKNTIVTLFLGSFSSDPSTSGVATGAIYYNTTVDSLKVFNGTAFATAVFDAGTALTAVNNLSDVNNPATSVTNLGLAYNTIAVTAASGEFYLDGTALQKASLAPSIQYRFDQSHSSNSGHPLKFSTTADGTHDSGSEFTTGVTVVGTAGQAGAYVQITVQQDSPTLYYYCANHSGMGSTAYKSGGSSSASSSGGTASAYVVPDASATYYMWKTIEIVPNNTTIAGTWQGMDRNATLYIGESDTIDSHYNYFETVATIDNHAAYQFIYVGDAATVTVPSGKVLHGFADAPIGGSSQDKFQSTGRVVYFGDN
jgi:hypothetical protein